MAGWLGRLSGITPISDPSPLLAAHPQPGLGRRVKSPFRPWSIVFTVSRSSQGRCGRAAGQNIRDGAAQPFGGVSPWAHKHTLDYSVFSLLSRLSSPFSSVPPQSWDSGSPRRCAPRRHAFTRPPTSSRGSTRTGPRSTHAPTSIRVSSQHMTFCPETRPRV